jgi:hypothetical protein
MDRDWRRILPAQAAAFRMTSGGKGMNPLGIDYYNLIPGINAWAKRRGRIGGFNGRSGDRPYKYGKGKLFK